MKAFAEKLRPVEQEMANERGPFLLFALFLREDAPNLWDLLVSAPWIESDKADALHYIVAKLQTVASAEELGKLSRIAIIEKSQPALAAIQSAIHVEHSLAEIQNSNFFGLDIKHAYIITSRREA
jgi:hypothetical protein